MAPLGRPSLRPDTGRRIDGLFQTHNGFLTRHSVWEVL